MFVNVGIEGGEAHDELHLYSAPGILGPWKPHPRNPVKSDVRSARPAGRVYHVTASCSGRRRSVRQFTAAGWR